MITKKELKSLLYKPCDKDYLFTKLNKDCIALQCSIKNHITMQTWQLYSNKKYSVVEKDGIMYITKI